ncbi:MAG: NAD(P)-dependent dehydrogenase (short-subunit alcohol dehydrogenase family) [Gammaproteobacteria bacterium]|jgi:NAD(P)-dependent dehydrogenase (short-subunit alcohol dehydrogenase family)
MNKIAIVTGASRGIGAATALLLGQQGYQVCVNYRGQRAKADAVVAQITSAAGQAIAVQADVGEPEQVQSMFAQVDEAFGAVTALVNSAGLTGPTCRFEALQRADLEQVMRVNVLGLMHCTQEAVRRMSTRHGGHGGAIVNVSSGSATRGNPGNGVHYAVSKGAVNSFTIGLSQELAAEGIRVNAVSPGLTRTEMPDQARLEPDSLRNEIPMGRAGEPLDIAEGIVWLLSEHASYVAGANLRVAGGKP